MRNATVHTVRRPLKAQGEYYTFFLSIFDWFQYIVSAIWRTITFGLDLSSFFTSLFGL